MRWYLLAAVTCGLSITDAASHAQRPPGDQRLSSTRSTPQDAGFFATAGVVRFQLIHGRLCLDPPRHRKGSQSRDQDNVYESITVTAERGIPSLHYVCQTPDQHLTLSVQQAGSVRIESFSPKTSERSVLDQPAIGKISWQLTRGDLIEQHTGATLLHARQCDPVGFDFHYGLLFERVLRGQSIADISNETQSALLRQAGRISTPDPDSIRATIEQLRSPRRASRSAAERQLVAWGTPIVPILHASISDDMEPEQLDRLRQIMRRLRIQRSDTPASLAMLLINDQDYWTLVGHRLSGDQVKLANQHLKSAGLSTIVAAIQPAERIAAAGGD